MSSPFKPIKNGASRPMPGPKPINLQEIPEDEWPAARAEIIASNIHRELSNVPAYNVASPVVVPRVTQDGVTAHDLMFGLRKREAVALELMAASIAARIRNPGVLGANDPIPTDAVELLKLVRGAIHAADVFVSECHLRQQDDFNTMRDQMASRLDAIHYGDTSSSAKVKTRIVEDTDPAPDSTEPPTEH